MSAGIFTAVGWLMGTRTLTMTIKPDPEPACCGGGVYMRRQQPGPFCVDQPPSGCGQTQWGDCAANCYEYFCNISPDTWCYTYCLDIYYHCCYSSECIAP